MYNFERLIRRDSWTKMDKMPFSYANFIWFWILSWKLNIIYKFGYTWFWNIFNVFRVHLKLIVQLKQTKVKPKKEKADQCQTSSTWKKDYNSKMRKLLKKQPNNYRHPQFNTIRMGWHRHCRRMGKKVA